MKLERIVVGIDFTEPSLDAARWVARHVAPGAEIVLAHVITLPEPPPIVRTRFARRELLIDTLRAGADRRLREFAASLSSDRIWLDISEGDPASSLTHLTERYSADLLVVGAHGERAGLLEGLGSTAEALVGRSPIPVLVAAAPRERRPSRILVALDRSEAAAKALRVGRFLGEHSGADVTALRVIPSAVVSHVLSASTARDDSASGDPHDPPAALDGWLTELRGASGGDRAGVTPETAFGEPAEEIIAFARQSGSDLIVMGRRGAGGLRRAVLGSVVESVLRHAPCPVLVVTEPRQ